ncbi:HAD family hydrolase [Kitasatospora sp. NPDC058965]|uniref:HAD family hydrolase n=1 Tax=Kitasatospora sp. NPDC058965 TaxID=3346682 RepID=UPI0036AF2CB2
MLDRVLLIDLDDTLIPDVPAARAAIGDTLRHLGVPDGPEAVDAVFAATREVWRANPWRGSPETARLSSWEALWIDPQELELPRSAVDMIGQHGRSAWAAALTALTGTDRLATRAAAEFRTRRSDLLRPLPGVPAQLDRLRERHELWLTTDGCRPHQRRKLLASGLADRFAEVFVSGELGCAKADSAFAEAVRSRLDAAGRQVCLVIGDSASTDLRLAATGGWPALHLCDPDTCQVRAETVRHHPDLTGVDLYCRCAAR